MDAWWDGLSKINQFFFCAAGFFSVFFVWQLIMALIGLADEGEGVDDISEGGDADIDADMADGDGGDAEGDSSSSVVAFRLVSIRSIITFFTLFTWGTALYMQGGDSLGKAMGISSLWGLAGMVSIALVIFLLLKLVHTGTKDLSTCVGTEGTVYLDIPEKGTGEVRVMVSGVVTYVDARSSDGKALKAGTPIRVAKRLDQTIVQVETTES
jgi:hypothetical protein